MVFAAMSSSPRREPRPPASTSAVHPMVSEGEIMMCKVACPWYRRVQAPGPDLIDTGFTEPASANTFGEQDRYLP